MNRRGFLGAMLAACAAPAIVRAESIMRIKPVLLPDEEELTFYSQTIKIDQFGGRPPLFRGELGRYEGVRITGQIDADAIKRYSAALCAEINRQPVFAKRFAGSGDGVIVLSPSPLKELLG